jgi:small subunit ribosomal protein S34
MSAIAKKYLEEALTGLSQKIRQGLEEEARRRPGFEAWAKKAESQKKPLIGPTIMDSVTNVVKNEVKNTMKSMKQEETLEPTHFERLRSSLFEIIAWKKDFGVGMNVTRIPWKERYSDTYWTVKRVKMNRDLRHGRAWGNLTWKGTTEDKEQEIRGPLKKEWIVYTS